MSAPSLKEIQACSTAEVVLVQERFKNGGMSLGKVITIDGPAASGKSSVSRELARRLGWRWVSTGAFYRGLAYVAHALQMDLSDGQALADLSDSKEWEVLLTPENTKVLFRGKDVTEFIMAEEVGNIASRISHYPQVREALLGAQRACAKGPEGLVAEGRDCGTVVFPEALAKVYLTASSESRAARRAAEQNADPDAIIEAQKQRDKQDSTRKAAPLAVPKDALVLDSSALNLQEVVDQVENFVKARA